MPCVWSQPWGQERHTILSNGIFMRTRQKQECATCLKRTRLGIPPTPDRGPNPHFLEKRVLGSKNPHFPSFWTREFSVKKSPFSTREHMENGECLDRKLPFPAFARETENWDFWTPKPSFPGNGDSGPCLGSGESQVKARFLQCGFGPKLLNSDLNFAVDFGVQNSPGNMFGEIPPGFYPCRICLDDRGTGQWKWMEEVLRRTSLVPLVFPCFEHCFLKGVK